MRTPIVDFAQGYAESNALRLHMPGHKGNGAVEQFDLTEIEGADVLYHAQGILRESQDNAAELFGTAKTVYSTEGSSLCIRAMLYLVKLCGKGNRILAARNAHKSFMTAAALLDLEVAWLFSKEQTLLSCPISAQELEEALSKSEPPIAVYVTSPDYLGHMADIKALSEVCHRHGTVLLVDNAHGAYLRFLDQHPIDLGADLCCDSAHKTLPVLTGGAYLHIAKNGVFCEQAELAMSIFASTSPSYLILQSLDAANRYLSDGYRERLCAFVSAVDETKKRLSAYGQVSEEALKITLAPKNYGYTGTQIADILQKQNIVCEFADSDFVVMMLTPELGLDGLKRLENALLGIERKSPIWEKPPSVPKPLRCLSPRQALFSVSKELPLASCVGKILAAPTITCPPAIPIVVCGERIDGQAAECMQYYGIKTCRVIE